MSNRVCFFLDKCAARVESVAGHAHRDREQECHQRKQRADEGARRAFLFFGIAPLSPMPNSEADLKCDEHGREDHDENGDLRIESRNCVTSGGA